MRTIKVLLADDHAILRDGIRALLSIHSDIEIVGEASDGKDAIKKVKELEPDIVIMDVAMPRMDGVEATRRIRKSFPEVKVLILTQYDNKEYIVSAIKAGAVGYIPKRALGSDLVSALHAVHGGESFLYPSVARVLINDYQQHAELEPLDLLTAREKEVLKLIADGYTSREIANTLFISIKTAQGHRASIMAKLDIHNRTELLKYAIRKGLISIDA